MGAPRDLKLIEDKVPADEWQRALIEAGYLRVGLDLFNAPTLTMSLPAPKRAAPRKRTHDTLVGVLESLAPSGKTWRAEWAATFVWLDGSLGRPSLDEVLGAAWDHSARAKYTDMPRYLGTWLRREHARWTPRGAPVPTDNASRNASRPAPAPSAPPPPEVSDEEVAEAQRAFFAAMRRMGR